VFWIAGLLVGGNRVSAATEMQGLDIPEMGVPGYSGVKMDKPSETMLSR
jgi:ammonium transporter, Amt family